MIPPWKSFVAGSWQTEINVRDFIHTNFTAYAGDEQFLSQATECTEVLWEQVKQLMKEEHERGIHDAETRIPSSATAYPPGYIDQDKEIIVGLQTDKPLKRAIMPKGGVRIVKAALDAYGYPLDPQTEEVFSRYRKTHNAGVFHAYSTDILKSRHAGIITGLPDGYGRGRIIGDYRRAPLYGIDRLIEDKQQQLLSLEKDCFSEWDIRQREEISEQILALRDLVSMAEGYGFDIRKPASNALEAVQWLYFAYLAAIKEQDGAAMSLGRVSTFLDIYFERDLQNGMLDEAQAQEIIDQFVIKLRLVRFLRSPEYNELFSGDPVWITESIGGISADGRPLVTRNSFRMIHTLSNLGPAPEPNLTVLWSEKLPTPFKRYCARISAQTSALQYENDELMSSEYGSDFGIACCVSGTPLGTQMQFFGARCNLAKALLYAINGGRDELNGQQVAAEFEPVSSEYLDFDEVWGKFDVLMDWLAKIYIKSLNVIHYMHDKYAYERMQMAFHDLNIHRTLACGIAGLSVVADSLSAIKYGRVRVIRNAEGLAVGYENEQPFPAFGNNRDDVDQIAVKVVKAFTKKLQGLTTYRNAEVTLSVLTITSNVVYGKKTGDTPDGRKAGEPFAPGANPMHGRDSCGAVASMASVAKLPYEDSKDGISYTFSIVPEALGKQEVGRSENLVSLLDGYFRESGHHINVNVLDQSLLRDAMEHPEEYPQLTVRVSGYAVNFIKLTQQQQMDVINRTYHSAF